MSYFVHANGICESVNVGAHTRIWAFAHVLPGAVIGADCNLCDHVFVENDVVVGDRVTIKNGVQLWDGIRVADDVFIGPNATFTNDKFPRSKQHQREPLKTRIEQGASIGANATILPGLVIGREAMIGSGSVVTRDVPPGAIVMGNPARIVGYADTPRHPETYGALLEESGVRVAETSIPGVMVYRLDSAVDLRGSLAVCEFGRTIPFNPKRVFLVHDVPSKDVRGEHAHKTCEQFLVCVSGSVAVVADNGSSRLEIVLDRSDTAVYLPPMIWGIQYKYSSDAVLMVLASHHYDAADYIRDYTEYLSLVRTSEG